MKKTDIRRIYLEIKKLENMISDEIYNLLEKLTVCSKVKINILEGNNVDMCKSCEIKCGFKSEEEYNILVSFNIIFLKIRNIVLQIEKYL